MLICIFPRGILGGVEELEAGPGAGITDEVLAQDAPFVRALLVKRLEQAWRACDPHIQVQRNPETGLVMRPDPRFVEAGLRILDRLADLYRLKSPISRLPDADIDGRAGIKDIVRAQIEEMESRLQEP